MVKFISVDEFYGTYELHVNNYSDQFKTVSHSIFCYGIDVYSTRTSRFLGSLGHSRYEASHLYKIKEEYQ